MSDTHQINLAVAIDAVAENIAKNGLNPIEDGMAILKVVDHLLSWVRWTELDRWKAEELVVATLFGLDGSYGWVGRTDEWEDWFYPALAQLYVMTKKGRPES